VAPLNHNRGHAIFGLRKAVTGDDAALCNGLLLWLRDAARVPGRKVIIVFSNGPDNASMIAPDDVRAVAEDEGIPIYVISTSEVNKDPVSSAIFNIGCGCGHDTGRGVGSNNAGHPRPSRAKLLQTHGHDSEPLGVNNWFRPFCRTLLYAVVETLKRPSRPPISAGNYHSPRKLCIVSRGMLSIIRPPDNLGFIVDAGKSLRSRV